MDDEDDRVTEDNDILSVADDGDALRLEVLLQHNPEEQVKVKHFQGGENALMFAVREGHLHCVQLLLQYCPEEQVKATNNAGKIALMFATDARCMELLLQHCPEQQAMVADPNNEITPLMYAVGMGYTSIVQLLLKYSIEAQVKAVNRYGLNALMYAANEGKAPCLELLLQHYPEEQVKSTSCDGWTALMMAVCDGHTSCVKLLLQHCPEHQVDEAIRILEEEDGPMSDDQRNCILYLIAAREMQRSRRIRKGGGGPMASTLCGALLASVTRM